MIIHFYFHFAGITMNNSSTSGGLKKSYLLLFHQRQLRFLRLYWRTRFLTVTVWVYAHIYLWRHEGNLPSKLLLGFICDEYYETIDQRFENKKYYLARPISIVGKIFFKCGSMKICKSFGEITSIIFHSMVTSLLNCWSSEKVDLIELWPLLERISSWQIRN